MIRSLNPSYKFIHVTSLDRHPLKSLKKKFRKNSPGNAFCQRLVDEDWALVDRTMDDLSGDFLTGLKPKGMRRQYVNKNGKGDLMMLPSDMSLLKDPEFGKWIRIYASDYNLMRANFSKAFKLLTEVGSELVDVGSGASSSKIAGLAVPDIFPFRTWRGWFESSTNSEKDNNTGSGLKKTDEVSREDSVSERYPPKDTDKDSNNNIHNTAQTLINFAKGTEKLLHACFNPNKIFDHRSGGCFGGIAFRFKRLKRDLADASLNDLLNCQVEVCGNEERRNRLMIEKRKREKEEREKEEEERRKNIATNMVKRGKPFKMEEVEKHNSKNDCWVVINGQVCDLTNFMGKHPGGEGPILRFAGKDASAEWNAIHRPDAIEKCAVESVVGYLV